MQAFKILLVWSFTIFFIVTAKGSLLEKNDDDNSIRNTTEHAHAIESNKEGLKLLKQFFKPKQISYFTSYNCPHILKATKKLTQPETNGINRPSCLDLEKIQALDTAAEEKYVSDISLRINELLSSAKNHVTNTPPCLFIAEPCDLAIRKPIFQAYTNGLSDIMKTHQTRKMVLESGQYVKEINRFLRFICETRYQAILTPIAINFSRTLEISEAASTLTKLIKREATIEKMTEKPDWTKFDVKNLNTYSPAPFLIFWASEVLSSLSEITAKYKAIYPIAVFIDSLSPDEFKFLKNLQKLILNKEDIYMNLQAYNAMLSSQYEYYQGLRNNSEEPLSVENRERLKEFMEQEQKKTEALTSNAHKLIKSEYKGIEDQVISYVKALDAARLSENKAESKLSQQRSQSRKLNHQKQMAQAARLTQELHVQQQAAAARNLETLSNSLTSQRPKKQFATNEGAWTDWYMNPSQELTPTQEARRNAQEALNAQEGLALAKANKNHTADPLKAQVNLETPEIVDLPKQNFFLLGSNHYKLFQTIMTDKYCEEFLETLENLLDGMGGFIEPYRAGSRVAIAIRHIQNPDKIVRTSIHYHSKNGVNALRPAQVIKIQDMFTAAGYTLETVLKRDSNNPINVTPQEPTKRSASNDDDGSE